MSLPNHPSIDTAVKNKSRKPRTKTVGKDKVEPVVTNVHEHGEDEDTKVGNVVADDLNVVEKKLDEIHEIIGAGVLDHLGNYVEEPFTILEAYFQGQHLDRLVRHQIESYNHFINYQMQKTIQMFNPVIIRSENDYVEQQDKYLLEISVSFQNFKLYSPQIFENNGATKVMFPQEAKLRNFTYASTMTVDIKIDYTIRNTETMDNPRIISKTLQKINIGKMPIMLKSSICVLTQNRSIDPVYMGECPMDCGGYFIIKGSEKTVLGQERAAENRVYCFDGKNTTKWSWFAEMKSIPDFKCISPKQIEMMIASKNNGFGHGIYMNIPRIKMPIELFVVFRALGVMSDKAICEYILLHVPDDSSEHRQILEFLQASIIDANKYMLYEDALRHITASAAYTPINMDKEKGAKKKQEFTQDVLNNDLFPHCKTLTQKLYMLGYMCLKLIKTSLGWLPPDDRDSYVNKRIELTGTLLNNLFRNYFNKLVKEMQKQVVREINNGSWRSTDNYENIINMTNIYKIMKSTTIENGINRALATGDFSIKQSNSSKVGVAQVLNRLTYLSSLSHSRRINTPLEKSGELIAPRKLHNTTWGFLCLTGDTQVLMGNRTDMKCIKDIRDGDWVNTVNRTSLLDEPSHMYNHFCKMPDKLYQITTISGRTIKATADHPFLVNQGNQTYQMVKTGDLKPGDNMVIRHMVKMIPDENTTRVIIPAAKVMHLGRAKLLDRLLELNLVNVPLPLYKLKIIARLIGLQFFGSFVMLNEQEDAFALVDDMKQLGFVSATVAQPVENEWMVIAENTEYDADCMCYEDFMYLVGNDAFRLPDWLITAERSIKREFLSTFLRTGMSHVFSYGRYRDKCIYMRSVQHMLHELHIQCDVVYMRLGSNELFEATLVPAASSLETYYDTIGFTYCEEMRRQSAVTIELLKIRTFSNLELTAPPNWSVNGCVSVPILSIEEIEPELVYDFTTFSGNHSFVASSFVSSNCAAETPEGQSIGVVKNISYMGHITIPTNSSSLYEYILPKIRRLEDMANPHEAYDKVRVFINGAWVGVTDHPQELYQEIKEKKYNGIINIYTSIVFDYKHMEIRVCNDGGRLTRPVLKVKDQRALITMDIIHRLQNKELSWNDLLVSCRIPESVIEYIDPEEQNFAMIAMKAKDSYILSQDRMSAHPQKSLRYTHCEIHPSTIFGVLASCIPFPEHNQSPRNTYQCLCIKERVLYADGSSKQIQDVKVGDKVLTFHPETLTVSETEVLNQFVIPNTKDVYSLTTISGKEIVATIDHNFMTDKGWKTVEDIMRDPSIRIGVCMNNNIIRPIQFSSVRSCVLIEDDFIDSMLKCGIEDDNRKYKVSKWVQHLKNDDLLPLMDNHPRLAVISRILGLVFTDGNISITKDNNISCTFSLGTMNDALQLQNDIVTCGFDKNEITEHVFEGLIHGRLQKHCVYNVQHTGCLPALLVALGANYGKKTEMARNPIPVWIMNNDEYGRQFMKGFQGDGCRIRWNHMKSCYNFICAETSQQICNEHQASLVYFMDQCVQIIRRFNVEVSDVRTRMNCDADDRVIVSFKISDKHANLIKYFDNIGYAYAETKNSCSYQVIEYLKAKEIFVDNHRRLINKVRMLYDTNMANGVITPELYTKQIHTQLAHESIFMELNTIRDIIRSYQHGREISTPRLKEFNIENWINKTTMVKNNCLFVPVSTIVKTTDQLISCIETASENHSFITTHGFLSKNCCMGKQAIGVYALNFDQRMDKTSYVLTYPSRPLVDTRLMNFIQLNRIPSGHQITVAIASYTAYNQEDSILMNKGSVDRGLFMTTVYHTEKDEDKNIIRDEIIRCKPDPNKTKGIKYGNYDKLNSEGFIPENELVENRDVIIAKTVPIKENRNDPTKTIKYEDQSKTFRTTEECYVDKNYTGRNGDGYNFAKVRVRTLRKPVLGDKFSSRAGQKGTCGCIIPEEDMPYTKDGLRPDIIINPHAIPSRMTIGQLKETILGKVILELGMFGDGTSFGDLDVKTICEELQRIGYESYGNEVMYNGFTGEQMNMSIFIGPVYYQRLKHMVNDKQHSRSIGPMVNLTRQPAEGRSRDGGFRIGEMERDVMIAHGMSRFCRERLYDVSDKYATHVCGKCGMIACYNDRSMKQTKFAKNDMTIHLCRTCGNMTDFAKVEIPYAYKLLSQELQTINIIPRIITE